MAKQAEVENEKLQKILARAGFGSRREVEKYIDEGLVKVNGKIATLGDRALPTDNIQFRGNAVKETRLAKQPTQVILYNKPEGQVCTRKDEKDRTTIFEKLPRIINGRWISVGRLDINTSGLLILTNNGELANRMMHPSYEVEREYSVRVFGEVGEDVIYRLKNGVKLEDGMAKFDKISKLPKQDDESINTWYKVVLKEGRNREVRRIWESQDIQISRLIRTRYGLFDLPRKLKQSKTEELSWKQINQLLKSVGMREELRPDLRSKSSYDNNKQSNSYAKKSSKDTRSGNNERARRSDRGLDRRSTKSAPKSQRSRT